MKKRISNVWLFAITTGVIAFANAEYYCNGQLKRNGGVRYYPNGQIVSNGGVNYYPNGNLVKNGPAFFHPNGNLLNNGSIRFYSNGQIVNNGPIRFYPNGQLINNGSTCFNPDGSYLGSCPATMKMKANAGTHLFILYVNLLGSEPLGDIMELIFMDAKMQTEFSVTLSTGNVGDIFAWCF